MPNWCYNSITAKKENLEPYIKDGEFDFDLIIPEPKTKEECPPEYIGTEGIEADKDKPWFNWYFWRLNNWGCKWNSNTESIDENDGLLTINFFTPWAAPQGIIEFFQNQDFTTSWVYNEDCNETHHLELGGGEIEDEVEVFEEEEY